MAEPHTGIVGEHQGTIMNLVDADAKPAQAALLDVVHEHPDKTLRAARRISRPSGMRHRVPEANCCSCRCITRSDAENVDLKRLGSVLAVAYERDLHDFAELLLLESLGPRTLQSLALIAEVVHGVPCRFSDPARFSFAHGGKDGHPFPVPLKTYDESLDFLRTSLDRASVGDRDKLDGFRRLERFARTVETRLEPEAMFDAAIAHERAISPSLDGRTVMGAPVPNQKSNDYQGRSRYSTLAKSSSQIRCREWKSPRLPGKVSGNTRHSSIFAISKSLRPLASPRRPPSVS